MTQLVHWYTIVKSVTVPNILFHGLIIKRMVEANYSCMLGNTTGNISSQVALITSSHAECDHSMHAQQSRPSLFPLAGAVWAPLHI